MKYLLLISTIALLFTMTANARDWEPNNTHDQLRSLGLAAGTYLLGRMIEDKMHANRLQSTVASGLIVGSTAFLLDYSENRPEAFQRHKSQGTAIGVGFCWLITIGFGI